MKNFSRPWPAVAFLFATAVIGASGYSANNTWSVPADLGPVVNTALADNRSPQVSADGRSLYLGSTRAGGYGGLDLYVSHRANPNSPWEEPVNLGPAINGTAGENNAYPSEDGHYLFFNSNRPGGCGGNDLYVSHRADPQDDGGWETAVNLGCVVNSSASDSGPVVIRDPATGLLLLFFASSRTGGPGMNDFYVSRQTEDGSFGATTLIPEISSPYDDNKLSVHPDGLDVFLSSNRPGGGSGAAGFNIWSAHRDSVTEPWSTPTLALESAGLPSLAVNRKLLYVVVQQPGSNTDGVPFLNDIAVSELTRVP
jgi:hypothetical protein